jgi:hypothetical protein
MTTTTDTFEHLNTAITAIERKVRRCSRSNMGLT